MTRPQVCLVVGNAHGGTTITNILIGQHDSVISVGTLKGFPDNGQLVAGNSCSCGADALSCSFWQKVASNVDQAQSLQTRDASLFSSVLAESNSRIVVDVDHGLHRLLELVSNPGLDVRVIYVDRQLSGVIHSQVRKTRERSEISVPAVNYIRLCLSVGRAWAFRPQIVARFCGMNGVPQITIRYERLCSEPDIELNLVGELLGIDYRDVSKRISRERVLEMPRHLIRGNQKLRQNGIVTLRLAESSRGKRQYGARFFGAVGAAIGILEARVLTSRRLRQMGQSVGCLS